MKFSDLNPAVAETLIENVKRHEGGEAYQSKTGSFKDGMFYVYKDSRDLNTIGYGHLVRSTEDFNHGLTVAEANELLRNDLNEAVMNANNWIALVNLPAAVQLILIEMVFQLGKSGAMKFEKFAANIRQGRYAAAAADLKDSNWYLQTPSRVEEYIQTLNSIL